MQRSSGNFYMTILPGFPQYAAAPDEAMPYQIIADFRDRLAGHFVRPLAGPDESTAGKISALDEQPGHDICPGAAHLGGIFHL
jgi:hypothetical protein